MADVGLTAVHFLESVLVGYFDVVIFDIKDGEEDLINYLALASYFSFLAWMRLLVPSMFMPWNFFFKFMASLFNSSFS